MAIVTAESRNKYKKLRSKLKIIGNRLDLANKEEKGAKNLRFLPSLVGWIKVPFKKIASNERESFW